jgi:hypothetical protein
MWPVRHAQFGMIDDHGIVGLVGTRPRLPIGDILPTIVDTAIEPIGRFRPLFWVGQVLECALAGRNPHLWYLDRFLLAAITLAAVFWACSRFLHPLLAGTVALSMVLGPQFNTWIRLGAAEAYAMPLLAVGLAWLVHRRGEGDAGTFVALAPGFACLVLAALVKENFLLLSGPALVIVVLVLGRRSFRRKDWVVWGALMTATIADALMIVVQLKKHSAQYAQVRNLETVEVWARSSLDAMLRYQGLAVAGAIVIGVALSGAWRSRRFTVALALAISAYAGQVLFYAGGSRTTRYLYPLVLASAVLWVLGLGGRRVYGRTGALTGGWIRVVVCWAAGLSLVLGLVVAVQGNRRSAEGVAQSTVAFRGRLDRIEQKVRAHHLPVVVLQPYEPLRDQEMVVSLARYLHAETGASVMTTPAKRPSTEISQALAVAIEEWSREGAPVYSLVPYDPPSRCLSVVFARQDSLCPRTARPPR